METEEIKTTEEEIKEVVDFGSLFEGTSLTEEVKTKITTIFEAALGAKVEEKTVAIQEEFQAKFEQTLDEVKIELVEKIDSFLDYAVEEWVNQNRIALENGIRNEITENFILGLKELFAENFIEVPEEKYDLIGEMETDLGDLTTKLDEQLAKNVALNSKINTLVKEAIVNEVGAGLTAIDSEKFKGLVENVEFESESAYKEKVVTIKENYFPKVGTVKTPLAEGNTEEKETISPVRKYTSRWIQK
ncbi:MAG: hypothetical protein PHG08_00535 [Bacilli bacterium]|nr:hypothetical protein [Bacilli bacterium]